jgi:hypothetical protein
MQQIINLNTGGGGNVTPGSVNWSNIKYDAIEDIYTINVQQITLIDSPITLSITFAAAQMIIYYRIDTATPSWTNGGSYGGSVSGFTQLFNGDTLTINNNEYLSFFCEPDLPINASTTVTITNTSDGNAVLDQFGASIERFVDAPCYLTTAMVDYYGYDDDGPELNALRQLRETKGEEYKEVLVNYQENSSIIIDKINFNANPEYWYNYIREEVLKVVELVEVNNFDEAAIVYVNLYENLKVQFLTE